MIPARFTAVFHFRLPKHFGKSVLRVARCVVVVAICLAVCALSGCIESYFELASDSRLPAGVVLPSGLTRANASVTLEFHTTVRPKFILRGVGGKKLETVNAEAEGDPIYIKTAHDRANLLLPFYEIMVVDGVTEVIKCIPSSTVANVPSLFYVVDDPALKKELLASRGLQR